MGLPSSSKHTADVESGFYNDQDESIMCVITTSPGASYLVLFATLKLDHILDNRMCEPKRNKGQADSDTHLRSRDGG